MKVSDAILGTGAIVLGIATFLDTLGFPKMPGGAPGPALFPQILSVLLIGLGLVVVVQSLRPHTAENNHYEPVAILKAGAVLVFIAIYVAVVQRLGFLITATLIMLGMMLMLSVRLRVALPAALGIALFSMLLFERILRVPLPPGILGG